MKAMLSTTTAPTSEVSQVLFRLSRWENLVHAKEVRPGSQGPCGPPGRRSYQDPDVAIALSKATNQQLLDEIMKRSDPQARYLFGGDEDTIGLSPQLSVVSDADDMNDGTVRPFDYSEYAADSSEDETEARLERGEDLID